MIYQELFQDQLLIFSQLILKKKLLYSFKIPINKILQETNNKKERIKIERWRQTEKRIQREIEKKDGERGEKEERERKRRVREEKERIM